MEPPTSGSVKLVSSPEMEKLGGFKLEVLWNCLGLREMISNMDEYGCFNKKNYGSVWIYGKWKCDGILMNCVDLLEINGELNELYVI